MLVRVFVRHRKRVRLSDAYGDAKRLGLPPPSDVELGETTVVLVYRGRSATIVATKMRRRYPRCVRGDGIEACFDARGEPKMIVVPS